MPANAIEMSLSQFERIVAVQEEVRSDTRFLHASEIIEQSSLIKIIKIYKNVRLRRFKFKLRPSWRITIHLYDFRSLQYFLDWLL